MTPSRHQRKKAQRRRKAAKISAHAYGLKYVIRDLARSVIADHLKETQGRLQPLVQTVVSKGLPE